MARFLFVFQSSKEVVDDSSGFLNKKPGWVKGGVLGSSRKNAAQIADHRKAPVPMPLKRVQAMGPGRIHRRDVFLMGGFP